METAKAAIQSWFRVGSYAESETCMSKNNSTNRNNYLSSRTYSQEFENTIWTHDQEEKEKKKCWGGCSPWHQEKFLQTPTPRPSLQIYRRIHLVHRRSALLSLSECALLSYLPVVLFSFQSSDLELCWIVPSVRMKGRSLLRDPENEWSLIFANLWRTRCIPHALVGLQARATVTLLSCWRWQCFSREKMRAASCSALAWPKNFSLPSLQTSALYYITSRRSQAQSIQSLLFSVALWHYFSFLLNDYPIITNILEMAHLASMLVSSADSGNSLHYILRSVQGTKLLDLIMVTAWTVQPQLTGLSALLEFRLTPNGSSRYLHACPFIISFVLHRNNVQYKVPPRLRISRHIIPPCYSKISPLLCN